MYFCSYWPSWMPNWKCFVATLLSRAWNTARWNHSIRQDCSRWNIRLLLYGDPIWQIRTQSCICWSGAFRHWWNPKWKLWQVVQFKTTTKWQGRCCQQLCSRSIHSWKRDFGYDTRMYSKDVRAVRWHARISHFPFFRRRHRIWIYIFAFGKTKLRLSKKVQAQVFNLSFAASFYFCSRAL